MSARERPIDRGSRLAVQALSRVGSDIRLARVAAGLSVDVVAVAAGVSNAQVSRIERGLAAGVPLNTIARLAAVVGLDLSIRTYPGGDPLRDAAQHAVMTAFAALLHPTLRWAVEVPLPIAGDRRAWDGMVAGAGWRYGVEAETQPSDSQALIRRLQLKARDGEVDGLLLVLPNTRRIRGFLDVAGPDLRAFLPVGGSIAIARLRYGLDPGGGAVIVLPRVPRQPGMPRVPGTNGQRGVARESGVAGQPVVSRQSTFSPGQALPAKYENDAFDRRPPALRA